MDLESKIVDAIHVHFTDDSSLVVAGPNASYIWLHLKNISDLIPLLYRSTGTYNDRNMSIPISALLERGAEVEPRTR